MRKHAIPLNTAVAFEDEHKIFYVTDYQQVLECRPSGDNCPMHHGDDCYEEPYITVREEIRHAFPLSKLQLIFDPVTHVGRAPTVADMGEVL
jgi:hypothetical protein